jgi:hypothetical protein
LQLEKFKAHDVIVSARPEPEAKWYGETNNFLLRKGQNYINCVGSIAQN